MALDTLAERVDYALKESGHTPGSASAYVGCSREAITQWVSGASQSIKGEYLVRLADLTGFEANWIMLGKGPKRGDHAAKKMLKLLDGMADKDKEKLIEIGELLKKTS